jgi:hypothetical protein
MKQLINKQNNFLYLFFALIGIMFASSVVAQAESQLADKLFIGVIISMLIVSIKSLRLKLPIKAFIILYIFSALAHLYFDSKVLVFVILSSLMFFYITAFVSAYKQILLHGKIDSNKIIGSITLYLLLGNIWTMIYLMILYIDNSAFSGPDVTTWQQGFAKVGYYSFVTLTTLGYGDILPHNHIAEFFVSLETITGVFYIAIVVSSLISLRMNDLLLPQRII